MDKLSYQTSLGLDILSHDALETAAFGGCHLLSISDITKTLSPKLQRKMLASHESRDFELTADEMYFHTLGVINTLVWLNRKNRLDLKSNLNSSPIWDEGEELDEEDLADWESAQEEERAIAKLLNALIIAIET